jgi:hypothetical protein
MTLQQSERVDRIHASRWRYIRLHAALPDNTRDVCVVRTVSHPQELLGNDFACHCI